MLDILGLVIAVVVAIIGYRYAAKIQQSRTLDGYVIRKLEESGLDLTKECQMEFWFYGDDKSTIVNLAKELEKQKFQVYVSETEQNPKFVIRALKLMVPVLSNMQCLRKEFNLLAKKYSAVYDGWGCSV